MGAIIKRAGKLFLSIWFIGVGFMLANHAHGQENKLTIGYELKAYTSVSEVKQGFSGPLGSERKGFVTLHFARDLSRNFYFDFSGDFLIPKRRDPVANGPLSYNAANVGMSIGAHLSKSFDFFLGAKGGLLWNMRIQSEDIFGNRMWQLPKQNQTNFKGTISAGLRYQILDFLALQTSVSRHFYQSPTLNPKGEPLMIPASDELSLSPYSINAGISIDNPWEANLNPDHEPTYRRGAPIVEDRKLSVSYDMRGYSYSYLPNSDFEGSLNLVRKGFLRLNYKHYLSNHFFLETSGGYMLPNAGDTFFSGGPLNFQAANLDLKMGIRWGKVSLFTGMEGGVLWDIGIKTRHGPDKISWDEPRNVKSTLTGGFKAGMEYHIWKYLSAKAQLFYNTFQNSSLKADQYGSQVPAITEAEFAPFSAGIGVSISIPWKSRYNKGGGRRPRPPAPVTAPPGGVAEGNQAEAQTEADQVVQRELPPEVTRPPESTPAQLSFTNPIPARKVMTSNFGDGRGHEGLDINANVGDEILSVAKGEVILAGWVGGYGRCVKIRHPAGFISIYGHLSKFDVEVGDKVEKGTRIGLAGNSGDSTGPHLHFEILRMDLPINPRRYIIYNWESLRTGN
jgi:murein DD-endopeptidase MepM/ murein hydrolase activator NlpD